MLQRSLCRRDLLRPGLGGELPEVRLAVRGFGGRVGQAILEDQAKAPFIFGLMLCRKLSRVGADCVHLLLDCSVRGER